jgi:hypothetical protein
VKKDPLGQLAFWADSRRGGGCIVGLIWNRPETSAYKLVQYRPNYEMLKLRSYLSTTLYTAYWTPNGWTFVDSSLNKSSSLGAACE